MKNWAVALWGARITNDDWGTHPTIAYAVMYSAAFFEKDTERLVAMAFDAVPNRGPFKEGMRDVIRWHKQQLAPLPQQFTALALATRQQIGRTLEHLIHRVDTRCGDHNPLFTLVQQLRRGDTHQPLSFLM